MDVSILVLTHKESEYIDKAIQTSLSQKFNGEFEVILCSDGDLNLKKYSDKYNIPFALSDKKNNLTTCSYNINKGIEISKGRYIKILAYDDWLPEDSIQILYNKIIESNSSLVCANSNEMRGEKITVVKSANIDYTLDKLLVKNVIHGGTVLFSKNDFLEVGGYNNDLKFAEEYDFHLNLLSHNKKFSYIDKNVHFYRRHNNQKGSLVLTPEQRLEKQKYVNNLKSKYYGNDVVCGVATIKERRENLKLTVNSIINQVDKLIVYQNGYKEIFDFLKHDKIEVISSMDTKIDMGDAGKFYKLSEVKNSYYLTIDDDLIYPTDYVTNIIKHLNKFNNNVIVSHHGRRMKYRPQSYYLDILEPYRCLDEIKKVTEVHFGGTGVMCLHTGFINNLSFDYFKSPNMADIWVGKFAEENNVPIMVLPHKKGWITTSLNLNETNTIHKKYQFKHDIQNEVIRGMDVKLRNTNKFKVLFLTCTYKRPEITEIFVKSLEDIQKKTSNYFEFINVVVDSDESNLSVFKGNKNFIYHNHTNNPVSNKWNYGLSLCKNMEFDYLFVIGSDDIIDESLMVKYHDVMEDGYEYFGIEDLYFYDLYKKDLFYWGGYDKTSGRVGETIGLGRCISINIIKHLNFNIWVNGLDKGLDKSMESKIQPIPNIKKTTLRLNQKYFACDIKSNFNITKIKDYTNLKNIKNHPDSLTKALSKNGVVLSIIIPTYNSNDYLNECLISIIKSIKNLNCEILIGIDGCKKTLDYIKNKSFDSRIRFFYFDKNVGPYIVKNSLSLESNSNFLVFFDSDDVMTETFIQDIIGKKNTHDLIKPMYLDFKGPVGNINRVLKTTNTYGEGVFGINKNIFLNMNGFEGWRCAADSDLMGRLYKNNIKLTHTKQIGFYRRIHPNSLTQHPDTNMSSKLRGNYSRISKTKKDFGPLHNLITERFQEVSIDYANNTIIDEFKIVKDNIKTLLTDVIKIDPKPKQTVSKINYDLINNLVNLKDIYHPSKHIKPSNDDKPKQENKPINRNEIFELKKGTLAEQNLRMFGGKKKNRF